MKAILSEKNLVMVLFVMVFIIFSLAHEDSKKMEQGYMGINTYTATKLASLQKELKTFPGNPANQSSANHAE
ncbi:MAG TPA: hypothetical protein VKC90_03020 [Chitinophagaceae bacterium]|nr:hypothetical protein [Chitinophagaceae bacterium]